MAREKPLVVMSDYDFEESTLGLVAEPINTAGGEFRKFQCASKRELLSVCRDASVLINEYLRPIDADVMDAMPECKGIVRTGIGVDTVDLVAAADRGIMVVNIPAYCLDEVSDHALALALALVRKIHQYNESVRNGVWDFKVGKPIARIRGQVLGLIGYGRVGRRLRVKAEALGFRVVATDPYVDPYIAKVDGVELLTLDAVLSSADVVSIHCPLTAETKGMLGEAELGKMKASAILVNTARGPIVQHDALARALRDGRIAGAGIDVQENEPLPSSSPLRTMACVLLTPHVAWYSEGSQKELLSSVGEESARILKGEKPLSIANVELLRSRQTARENRGVAVREESR